MRAVCVLMMCGVWVCGVCAQEAEPAGLQRLPSLEELLGLEVTDAEVDRTAGELERMLSAEEARESLAQAAGLMGDSAKRLVDAGDAGIGTQRLHDEILRKLDQVIATAREQQQNSSSSRRSSSQQQQQQQQQQQSEQRAEQTGSPDQAQGLPGRQDGELRPGVPSGSAAWGRLPERTREALIEGVSDRYSSLYERLTQEYYRRLAEDRP